MAGFVTKTIRWNKMNLLALVHNRLIQFRFLRPFSGAFVKFLNEIPFEIIFFIGWFWGMSILVPEDCHLIVSIILFVCLVVLFKLQSVIFLRLQVFYISYSSLLNFMLLIWFQAVLISFLRTIFLWGMFCWDTSYFLLL